MLAQTVYLNMTMVWMRTASIIFVIAGMAAAQDYSLELVARTGAGGLLTIDSRTGINDAGTIAFTGTDSDGSKGFVTQMPAPGHRPVTFFSPNRVFLGASINDAIPPQAAFSDRVSGSPPVWFIRRWNTLQSSSFTIIGQSPANFDSASSFLDINNSNVVALAPLVGGSTSSTLAASASAPPTTLATYSGIQQIRPQISETGQVVIRDNQSRIISWPHPSGTPTIYASATTGGFTTTSSRPGISDDGTVVAFEGTDATGPGVHVSVAFSGGRRLIPIARSGMDGITGFAGDRIGVTSSGTIDAGKKITVVFSANTPSGPAVLSRRLVALEVSGEVVTVFSAIQTIVRAGEVVDSQTVTGFELQDPINNNGFVAMFVTLVGGQAGILKATPSSSEVLMGPLELPMSGVEVEYGNDTGGTFVVAGSVRTNSNGAFSLVGVPNGTYKIRARLDHPSPIAGETTTIYNYPDNDADATFTVSHLVIPPIPKIIVPEPVVLIAGWRDGAGAWGPSDDEFLPFLAKSPADSSIKRVEKIPAFLCFAVDGSPGGSATTYDNDASSTQDHAQNGLFLQSVVVTRVLQNGVATWLAPDDISRVKVSFLAHSMGGIITRAALTSQPDFPWSRVITLDTPHGGSLAANILTLPLFLFGLRPPLALTEFALNGVALATGLPPTIVGWNEDYRALSRPGDWLLYDASADPVVFPSISAQGSGAVRGILHTTLNPWFGSGSGNGSTASINGWVRGLVVNAPNSLHSSGECLPLFCPGIPILRDPNIHLGVAQYLLGRGAPNGAAVPALAPPPPPVASTQGLGGLGIAIQATAGQTSFQTIPIDTSTGAYARFVLVGAGSQISVRTSLGQVLIPTVTQVTPIAPGTLLVSMDFASPPAGQWDIELTAGPIEGAQLMGTLYSTSDKSLLLDLSTLLASQAQSVDIAARLVDGSMAIVQGSGSTAVCSVVNPDGMAATIALFDDGAHLDGANNDGLWGGSYTSTSAAGRYTVSTQIETTVAGQTVRRVNSASFAVMSVGIAFASMPIESTPDLDANGQFDSLVVSEPIAFQRNGEFLLRGRLVDSGGVLISQASLRYSRTTGAGLATLDLSFPGVEISRHGVAGPWTVKGIVLADLEADGLPVASAMDAVTAAYAASSFESAPAPTVSWVQPSSGPRIGGNLVVFGGTSFLGATAVRIDGQTCSYTVTGDTTIAATVPANFIAERVSVEVITTSGNSTLQDGYTYLGQPCPSNRYCPATSNSAGTSARFDLEGTPSIMNNNLVLVISGAVPNQFVQFFYGPTQVLVPFGDGMRCVGGNIRRLTPSGRSDAIGTATKRLDFTSPQSAITVGSSWNFQALYRDPLLVGGAGVNVSDALNITFCN